MSNTADLECWHAFLAVVDSGGVARAAERLGMAKSMVSRRVTKLEQRP
jgi:DNA-binding transcriptional LysR family regulator